MPRRRCRPAPRRPGPPWARSFGACPPVRRRPRRWWTPARGTPARRSRPCHLPRPAARCPGEPPPSTAPPRPLGLGLLRRRLRPTAILRRSAIVRLGLRLDVAILRRRLGLAVVPRAVLARHLGGGAIVRRRSGLLAVAIPAPGVAVMLLDPLEQRGLGARARQPTGPRLGLQLGLGHRVEPGLVLEVVMHRGPPPGARRSAAPRSHGPPASARTGRRRRPRTRPR